MVFKSNDNCSHEFLDAGQYQKNGILRYERIFGETFVSTGGETTTRVCKYDIDYYIHVLSVKIQKHSLPITHCCKISYFRLLLTNLN